MQIKVLRIATGAFFILLGVAGVLTNVEESIFSLNNGNITLEIVVGVVEIACGVILLAGLFNALGVRTMSTVTFVVLIFWVARLVLANFFWADIPVGNTFVMIRWLLDLSAEVLIAAALWVLNTAYKWT